VQENIIITINLQNVIRFSIVVTVTAAGRRNRRSIWLFWTWRSM